MTYSQEKTAQASTLENGQNETASQSDWEQHLTLRARVYKFIIRDGKALTQLEAWGLFGCGDLRTVIRDLRRQLKKENSPYKIVTIKNKDVRGRLYGRYTRQLKSASA